MRRFFIIYTSLSLLFCAPLWTQELPREVTSFMAVDENFSADRRYAQVIKAEARQAPNGTWVISTTIDHNDERLPDGTEHYADRWEVVDPRNGEVLAVRRLLHSHMYEMPFTRSLSGVVIPEGLDRAHIRAACTHHGFAGRQVLLPLFSREE